MHTFTDEVCNCPIIWWEWEIRSIPKVTRLTTRTPWQVFACRVGMIISLSAGLSCCKTSGSWSCGFSSGEDVNTQDIGINHDHFRPKQYHTVSLVWTLWGKTAGTCSFRVSPFDFTGRHRTKTDWAFVYISNPCRHHVIHTPAAEVSSSDNPCMSYDYWFSDSAIVY